MSPPRKSISKDYLEQKVKRGVTPLNLPKIALISTTLWGFLAYHLLVITAVGNADAVCEGLYSYTAADWALACGRWCARYFYNAAGNVVMPGVWVTLYMLCVFLTVLLLARLWDIKSPISVFFTAALLAVNPAVIDQSLLQYMFMSWGISNLLGVGFVYIICRSGSRPARGAAAAIAVVLTALIPAFVNICRVIFPYFTVVQIMEYQIMLLFPFFFALAEEEEPRLVQTKNAVRILAFALSALLVCGYTVSANATYRAYALSYDHARYEAGEIMSRARALPDYEDGETVMFAGFIRDDTLRRTNGVYKYAYSMYDNLIFWEEYMGITSGRRNFVLNTLGIDPGEVDMAQYCEIVESDEFAAMPLYPSSGSVARIDGVIVAKLSADPLTLEDLTQ